MIEVEPGIYPGLTYSQYDQIKGINWSVLRRFKKSAAHARAAIVEPSEPNDEMDFGKAFHTLVLEPSLFEERYVVVPEDAPTKRSNAGKAWWAAFEEENKDKEGRVTTKELRELETMRNAIYSNARANELLTYPKALREVVVVWDEPNDAESKESTRCKGRIDLLSRWQGVTVVADVKTDRDGSAWHFGKDLDTYDWAGQLMWYKRGLDRVVPVQSEVQRVPYYLVVENDVPYCAVTYELGQASQEAATEAGNRYFRRYVEAETTGQWPGYVDGVVEMPAYALNRV